MFLLLRGDAGRRAWARRGRDKHRDHHERVGHRVWQRRGQVGTPAFSLLLHVDTLWNV